MAKELNLDNHIEDEVLNEIFTNENSTFENLATLDYESVEEPERELSVQPRTDTKYHSGKSNEDLVILIRAGVDVQKNRDALIMQNAGIVYKEAKACTCRIPFDDKVQYGFEGLLNSVDGFDPTLGYKFNTYAGRIVRQHMYRYGNREARGIEIPEYLSKENIIIQKYLTDFVNDNAREPSEQEVSEGTGIALSRVKRALRHNSTSYSLDTPTNIGDELTLQEVITSDDPNYRLNEYAKSTPLSEVLDIVFPEIKPLEAELISLVHGLNGNKVHTYDEILDLGIVDDNGSFITSKPTLSRRYKEAIESVKRVIARKKIYLSDVQ